MILKDTLERNIQVNLYGIATAGEYWEKRVYLKEKGAENDYTAYKCDTVVKIKKSALIKAVEASKAKAAKASTDESKKAINNAIDSYITFLKVEK